MIRDIYYNLKPIIPRYLQIALRRKLVSIKRKRVANLWPIDPTSSIPPEGWPGWPNDKDFALILTHDVDTKRGHDRCEMLLRLEEEFGFKSSFNFVPERYDVSPELRSYIINKGYEVGVHGLRHDGKLYKTRKIFEKRARSINRYLADWNSVGFRSPAMHHNLDWIHELNILYDASTFDTDPFEPQSDGVATIFPFWVRNKKKKSYYLELPYTLCQDFTLFILMRTNNIDVWRRKAEWIIKNKGMVLLNTHPDYMKFGKGNLDLEDYPVSYYKEFLLYIKENFNSNYWNPLPRELASYLKQKMTCDT